ncbi:universal stress protein [Thermodesulfobacteriota bacterium]
MDMKKILVALDRSKQSMDAARFITQILPAEKLEITLFMVFNKMPEVFWDQIRNTNNGFDADVLPIIGDAYEREKAAEEFMEQARQLILDSGVSSELVTVNIHDKKLGIARDILAEAELGDYRAVVIGRTGRSKVKDFVFGSVTHKVVQQIGDVPVWIIGGTPKPGRILVALDSSNAALRVIDYVGEVLAGSDFDITLFHAARELGTYCDETEIKIDTSHEEAWLRVVEKKMGVIFAEAVNRLVTAGIDRNQITIKIEPKVASRAAAIINEAQKGNYGTIFAGRRGLSQENKLMLGRVTYKLIHNAREMALCIVD